MLGGFVVSLALHAGLLFIVFLSVSSPSTKISSEVVYSATLESGSRAGGVSQSGNEKETLKVNRPEVKKKATPAPVVKKTPPPVEKKKEVVKVEKKIEPEKKAEKTKETIVKKTPEKKPVAVAKKDPPVEKKNPPVEKKATNPTVPKKTPEAKPLPAKNSNGNAAEDFQKAMSRYLGDSVNAGGKGYGSTGEGGNGMGGGVQKPREWIIYKNTVENQIKDGFIWHNPAGDLVVLIRFSISPAGAISAIRLIRPSGNTNFDAAAIRAVNKASPLPAPPAQFYGDFKTVEIDLSPY